jgi:hypothetical protein
MFTIVLPGKAPYAQQGGENPIENIKKWIFLTRSKKKVIKKRQRDIGGLFGAILILGLSAIFIMCSAKARNIASRLTAQARNSGFGFLSNT